MMADDDACQNDPQARITRLEAALEEARMTVYYTSAMVFSREEILGLQLGREAFLAPTDEHVELTEEELERARARIRERLKEAKGKPRPPVEPTRLEIVERARAAEHTRNQTLLMFFGDLHRQAGLPVPKKIEDTDLFELIRVIRGEPEKTFIHEWSWDSGLRSSCTKMRDALGVTTVGPMYDADNHGWTMAVIGAPAEGMRPLALRVAEVREVSPQAAIRRASALFPGRDESGLRRSKKIARGRR